MNWVTEEKPETSRHKEKLLKCAFSMFEINVRTKIYSSGISLI